MPLCNTVEVVESAYQSIVKPAAAVAVIDAVSILHFVAFANVVTTVGNAFIVAIVAVLVVDKQIPIIA